MAGLEGHEREVVAAAAARLIPGPGDDPDETTPGAREAGAVEYVDRLLAIEVDAPAPPVLLAGPFSDRAGADRNLLAERRVELTAAEREAWRQRLADWRRRYAAGVVRLDALAGGDFAAAGPATQDAALADPDLADFVDLLFDHVIEGTYGVPEHGGNRRLAGWESIGFHGDVQPRGFADDAVPTGRADPIDGDLLRDVLAIIPFPLVRDRDGHG